MLKKLEKLREINLSLESVIAELETKIFIDGIDNILKNDKKSNKNK